MSKDKSPVEIRDPAFLVEFDRPTDSRDPKDWSLPRKSLGIFSASVSCSTVVLYSTAYTVSLTGVEEYFGISKLIATIGLTVFLLGMAAGCAFVAPFSEMYGRRPVYIVSMAIFLITVIPTGVTKTYAGILIPRFFSGFAAASLVTITPGSVNDVVQPRYRALAFSMWSIGPMNGPVFGPIIGGFTYEYLGWRWISWLTLIINGVAFIIILCCGETFAPVILRKMASEKRKETGDERWWCAHEKDQRLWPLLRLNLKRPMLFMFTEPICIFWNLYVGLVYGVLYLSFVAYPIVFQTERGWSPGIGGLAFCGIGLGNLITIFAEPLCRKLIDAHKPDPITGRPRPEAQASIIVIGSILLATGQMVFAWTLSPDIHWSIPIVLGGVPFGAGNACVFIYASNYLAGSYGTYTASALAGNAIIRSIMGGVLPLAGPTMYRTLGANWASCLLALLEYAFVPIPVAFYLYGDRIRAKSPIIRQLGSFQ